MKNNYKIYQEKGKFNIYSVYGQFMVGCTNRKTAEYLLKKLEENTKIYEEKIKRGR
jgi:hypothetical protein